MQKINGWVILAIALLVYAFVPSVQDGVNGMFSAVGGRGTTSTQTTVVSGGACAVASSTITLVSNDKYNKNTAITNGSHRVFVNGVDKGYFAEAATLTASVGDKVDVYFGLNSTSHYPVKKSITVGCQGAVTIRGELPAMDAALTATVYDTNGMVMSVGSNEQTMAASSTYDNPIKLKATSKYAFGATDMPGSGNVICFQYNSTTISSVKINGADIAKAPNALTAVAGKSVSCNYIPTLENAQSLGVGASDGSWNGNIITTTGSTDPADPGSNISITVYDTNVALNTDNLQLITGIEDNNNNAIYRHATSATLYVN